MKKLQNCTRRANSLVEILIYVSLTGIILYVLMIFSIQIGDLYTQASNRSEVAFVSENIREALSGKLTQASGIDLGETVLDDPNGQLGLYMLDTNFSPTVFYLEDGQIYLREGLFGGHPISAPTVHIDSFEISYMDLDQSPDQVQIDLQVSTLMTQRVRSTVLKTYSWIFTLRSS